MRKTGESKMVYRVGQEVWMQSGPYVQKGKVSEMTEKYVLVEVLSTKGGAPGWQNPGYYFIRFDSNGKTGTGWDGLGLFEYIGPEVGMLQSDPRIPSTQFGPWKLIAALC
jgi:hypothetical protein